MGVQNFFKSQKAHKFRPAGILLILTIMSSCADRIPTAVSEDWPVMIDIPGPQTGTTDPKEIAYRLNNVTVKIHEPVFNEINISLDQYRQQRGNANHFQYIEGKGTIIKFYAPGGKMYVAAPAAPSIRIGRWSVQRGNQALFEIHQLDGSITKKRHYIYEHCETLSPASLPRKNQNWVCGTILNKYVGRKYAKPISPCRGDVYNLTKLKSYPTEWDSSLETYNSLKSRC